MGDTPQSECGFKKSYPFDGSCFTIQCSYQMENCFVRRHKTVPPVELALDSMSKRDTDGRSYGIPQRSTTGKPQAKIESQSGKAKVTTYIRRCFVVGKDRINKIDPNQLTTYPSRFSLNMQDSDTSVTVSTAKDSDKFVTMSDDDSTPSWTMVHERRRTRKVGREERLTPQGVR
jgi:hypothetical protein